MQQMLLAMDVGGTAIKYAPATQQGEWLLPQRQRPAHADGTMDQALGALTGAATDAADAARTLGGTITAACLAFPGPFDYRAGVSRMAHKYAAIQGVPIAPALRAVLPGAQVRFVQDAVAFLLGEGLTGAAADAAAPMGVTIGTGFGCVLMRAGRVLVGADLRPSIVVWNAPLSGGTVEDFVSRRAIRAHYAAAGGSDTDADVRALADLARAGDAAAIHAFRQAGDALGRVLAPRLLRYGCDMAVIGGQIAGAADLFLPAAQAHTPLPLRPARHADAALRGAAAYAARGDAYLTVVERSEGE